MAKAQTPAPRFSSSVETTPYELEATIKKPTVTATVHAGRKIKVWLVPGGMYGYPEGTPERIGVNADITQGDKTDDAMEFDVVSIEELEMVAAMLTEAARLFRAHQIKLPRVAED